jgi:hypothetical protein
LLRIFIRLAFGGAVVALCSATPIAAGKTATMTSSALAPLSAASWADAGIGGLRPDVLQMALSAASCAMRSGDVDAPQTLTVIDYSRPSTEKRLWVFDIESHELLYEELVAHGQGTGDNLARHFSNTDESHQSSLGLFATDDTYVGKNGYSLRLNGLEAGFNDRARERAIVMHGAPYVSDAVAKKQGRLGRSWGCPALSDAIARQVIDRVKKTGLVFAYYPDREWMAHSKYLGTCGAASALAN